MATQTVPQQKVPPPQAGAITVRENREKIVSLIRKPIFKEQLLAALMDRLDPDFVIRAAISQMDSTPEILECTPVSVASSLLVLAIAGLAPEPNKGHGWLIPRNFKIKEGNKERWEKRCTPLIGYRGYIDLAYRGKVVTWFTGQAVFEGDIFDLDLGSGLRPHHEPWIRPSADRPKRGEFLGSYAAATLKGSGECLVRWMTKEDIDLIRERSSASSKGPWVTDYIEMARKTPVRNLSKWIPDGELQKIAVLDEASDFGKLDAKVDEETGAIINVVRNEENEPAPQPIQPPQRLQNGTAAAPKAEPVQQSQQDAAAVPSGEVRERTIDRSVSQENEQPDPWSKDVNPGGKHISTGQVGRMWAILRTAQKMQREGVPTEEEFLAHLQKLGYRDPRFLPHNNRPLYDELCAWADSGTLNIASSNGENNENW